MRGDRRHGQGCERRCVCRSADPESRKVAEGFSLRPEDQIWLDPSGRTTLSPRNGGMIDPVRYDLKPQITIYRFASSTDDPQNVMRGGWWVMRPELDQLIRFAEVNGKSLGYAVRLLCCVPPEWGGALNFLIAVRTCEPVAAWRGLANAAYASDRRPPGGVSRPRGGYTRTEIAARNDIAAWRLHQLYIPGLRAEGMAARCLQYIGQWQTEGVRDWLFQPG